MIVISAAIKLSVIVPVYNAEKYLKSCIDSILDNQSDAYEIILVDDGATDGSPAVCDAYARSHGNVSVIHQSNGGLANARNTGLLAAKGDYVTFADADDYADSGYVDYLEPLLGADDIVALPYIIDYTETGASRQKLLPERTHIGAAEALLTLEEHDAFNFAWNKCYRRELLSGASAVRFQPHTEPGEDLLFNCRCFEQAKTVTLANRPFYHWMRRGEDTLANRFRCDLYDKNKLFIENRSRLYRRLGVYDSAFPLLAKGNLAYIFACVPNMYRKNHTFPRQERMRFYREILSCAEVAQWLDSAETSDALMRRFAWLYRRQSAFWMDAYYHTVMWLRNRLDKIWKLIRNRPSGN